MLAPHRVVGGCTEVESSSTPMSDPRAPHSLTPVELQAVIAAQKAGAPFVSFRDGDGALRLLALERPPVRIGRRDAADITLGWDSAVSGLHAELVQAADEWLVVDDGLSRNGTFVNGERVQGRKRLRDGDRLLVGDTVLAFEVPGAGAPPVTTAAAGGGMPEGELKPMQRRVLIALCRPLLFDASGFPASNRQIADEVSLTEDAIKKHLGVLFTHFGVKALTPNDKRSRLALMVLQHGLVSRRDYA